MTTTRRQFIVSSCAVGLSLLVPPIPREMWEPECFRPRPGELYRFDIKSDDGRIVLQGLDSWRSIQSFVGTSRPCRLELKVDNEMTRGRFEFVVA